MTETDRAESVQMIRDSVGAIAPAGSALKRIRALRFGPGSVGPEIWRQVVELGWLSLLIEEEQGGLGLGVRELTAIGEELGAALVPEPVLAVIAMAPLLTGNLRQEVLDGTRIVLPAWRETITSLDGDARTMVDDGKVSGTKILIAAANAADSFVVSTNSVAVLVERSADGVKLDLKREHDGGLSGTLMMTDAPCTAVAGDFASSLEMLALAGSGYLLGVAERAFEMTLEHLATRQQFGRLIGTFQVLQHRAAEAKIQLALSKAVLGEAIANVERGAAPVERMRSRSRAVARVSDTAMLIARETVQMHGAIGITDEHDIGLFCRKILSTYNRFGTASANRSRYLDSLRPEHAQ